MGLNIIIPKFTEGETLPVWMERGLREGNFLSKYLAREKAQTQARLTSVAQSYRNHERPRGCEFELISVMDPRTFHRWNLAEPGMMEDKNAFKKLVKDNPVMTPWKA